MHWRALLRCALNVMLDGLFELVLGTDFLYDTTSIILLLLCAYVVAALVLGVAKYIVDPPSKAELIATGWKRADDFDDDEPSRRAPAARGAGLEPGRRIPLTGRGAKKKARRKS